MVILMGRKETEYDNNRMLLLLNIEWQQIKGEIFTFLNRENSL